MRQVCAHLGFTLERADAATAFLQGRPISRELFCVPVPELARALGIPEGEAARLLKTSYGLVDAPWEWYITVVTTLKKLGWTQCELDPCIFVKLDMQAAGSDVVVGLAGWHVDDFEWGGRSTDARWLEVKV